MVKNPLAGCLGEWVWTIEMTALQQREREGVWFTVYSPKQPKNVWLLDQWKTKQIMTGKLISMMSKQIKMQLNTQSLRGLDWLYSYLLQHDVIHLLEVSGFNWKHSLRSYTLCIFKPFHSQNFHWMLTLWWVHRLDFYLELCCRSPAPPPFIKTLLSAIEETFS